MFDWKKPTVQLLGRFQPWHDGHLELFKRAYAKTGQVMIQIRDVNGVEDNPFDFNTVKANIIEGLNSHSFHIGKQYDIMLVPNITEIVYGRGVGYAITEEVLDEATQEISATKIREQMRKDGTL